jgi:hypothetical protein
MTPDERVAALAKVGKTIADVHRAFGRGTYHHVRYVVIGERRSPEVERVFADVAGVPVDLAFPPRETAAAAA